MGMEGIVEMETLANGRKMTPAFWQMSRRLESSEVTTISSALQEKTNCMTDNLFIFYSIIFILCCRMRKGSQSASVGQY